MKVIKSKEVKVRMIAENMFAEDYFTKVDNPEVSLSILRATDYNAEITPSSNWIYLLLEGEMRVNNSDKEEVIRVGDALYVRTGETFVMEGSYVAIIVCQPAF